MRTLAVLALAALGGCSLGVDDLSPPEESAATPLAIAGPRDGLVYTLADDDDVALPGVQLTVRVDVDDDAIQTVELALPSAALSDVVAEDLAGRRAAFFDVTLAGADTPVTATAALEALPLVEVRAILRAAP